MKKSIIFFMIIFQIFQIIVNIKCQYVPVERKGHTATLIEKKVYFLGGTTGVTSLYNDSKFLNDFFFLDLSKSIDTTKPIPFIDLSGKALGLPPHSDAAATPYSKDLIFLFGGYVNVSFNNNPPSAFSFNSTQLEWNPVTVSQGDIPEREAAMNAVTDNNNKIYLFGGYFPNATGARIISTRMNIFDTVNKIWTISESGLPERRGRTATFLPDTSDIIYIGGLGVDGLEALTNLDVYNTQNNSWRRVTTKNPPESRYFHSAVLTNDGRIILFGGAAGLTPVNNRYVVLDTKTFEWYLGKGDYISTRAPYAFHTATLYNDYMFIAFGVINARGISSDQYINQLSRDILIYKIGDYANFSLEISYDPTDSTVPNPTSISSTKLSKPAIIGISLGSILGVLILGIIGFFGFKKYKKRRDILFIPSE